MRRLFTLLLAAIPFMGMMAQEEIEMTAAQAKTYYKDAPTKRSVSIHDPSVVYNPANSRYYIFGSHKAGAYTTDFQNWTQANPTWKAGTNNNAPNSEAFVTPAVKKVKKGDVEVDFPAFNAMEWAARTDADYNINGNMWAPDVIWNTAMEKWCMYLSINGNAWHSSIILLTSDNITGPYEYQGPIVISGFQDNGHSYKGTDLELAIGTQTSLPSRYNVGSSWGNRWPNNIDPCVFYDEQGNLWLIYGSWSGGIWMLQLDEETGLRDYNVTYPITGSGDGVTSDPYFGKKIAGGYYVSGEGPYIEYINGYYYLFMSYGFFSPDGGYEMRVFRSENPDGPYRDAQARSAIFEKYTMNYGTNNSDMRGEKIMGAYNKWGFMTVGECAQGHNSIIAAPDGRTYLVYHTKFNNGTAGHLVRTHQVFQNKQGWLVAAPFEYNGETLKSADIASTQQVAAEDIPGIYQILIHKYRMNYANMEEVTPVSVELTADGKVKGTYSGTWSTEEGTCYLTIRMGSVTYNGVIFEEQIDGKTIKTISFTGMATSGVNVWGYKYRDDYSLAWQLNTQELPVRNAMQVNQNCNLYGIELHDNVQMKWTSDNPLVISDYGKYYPLGLAENTIVNLTGRWTSGRYFCENKYLVNALSEANSITTAAWENGMLAHYQFDADRLVNRKDDSQQAELKNSGSAKIPTLETDADSMRNGKVVHLNFGTNGNESYLAIPNPLKGQNLTSGATISFYVKRYDNNLWDALIGVTNGTERFYMTGNLYVGYNNGKTTDADQEIYNNWIDINKPDTLVTNAIGTGKWHMVTVTISPSSSTGISYYIDGVKRTYADRYKGMQNGKTVTAKSGFDYKQILTLLSEADEIYLGKGSFWGSPNVAFDELTVYNRIASLTEIKGMIQMVNRSDENRWSTNGIEEIVVAEQSKAVMERDVVYDLSGRKVQTLKPGLYIKNGKKFIIK